MHKEISGAGAARKRLLASPPLRARARTWPYLTLSAGSSRTNTTSATAASDTTGTICARTGLRSAVSTRRRAADATGSATRTACAVITARPSGLVKTSGTGSAADDASKSARGAPGATGCSASEPLASARSVSSHDAARPSTSTVRAEPSASLAK